MQFVAASGLFVSCSEQRTCAVSERRYWAPGCQPTERQARACLNALRSLDNLETKEDELDECDSEALCGGKPQPADAGGS